MAQLVERSLPKREIRGLNPVLGKTLSRNCTIKYRKDKNKEKEAGNGPSLKECTFSKINLLTLEFVRDAK